MPNVMPRPSILSIEPYVGGESKIPGVNRIIKLSSNEGAFGVPPAAQAAYAELAAKLHRYPDGGATALREAIGTRFGVDPARVVCGNGSDEIIQHLILAYGGEGTELVMSAHGFTMYEVSGRYAGCQIIKAPERNLTADVDAMLAAVGPRTRLMFLANPNNPTGSLLPAAEVTRLRAALREDVLLVLDSAYAEYVTRPDYDPGTALVEAGTNTVMTRTFSKVFGLGGVRLGWCYAPPHVIDVLNRVRGPFNVNAPAMAAGVAALAEPGWVEKSVAHNTAWRAKLSEALRAAGITVHPSEGNFILADFATPARAAAADAALKGRGLIVRAMGAYALPHCLRITIGTAEECGMVADALRDFMRSADAA
ncbi:histidinol-phosphate aminotransferase [Siccirubricoccus deserti]|uniref:Histidinol-phosphate aminotransferase n=1 Tax=Siccirubricoccus deserti TaxID=2013562 RepID=A0A9X0UBP1_9PROT|nr:histidinol-phosphate transaminase [Siccirubricoccus deserti]MBC4014214.1 histidinol-phosphate transaminase [Siccirubricoccus deserti]GGC27449.1 histidinol-phosphate aminotransferase [Siccirubricoccus deserti]